MKQSMGWDRKSWEGTLGLGKAGQGFLYAVTEKEDYNAPDKEEI